MDRPWYEADLLVGHLTGLDRALLHTRPHFPFPSTLVPGLLEALSRRKAREPLQYITGECDFMDMNLSVGPGCLVPRPETELLVLETRKFFSKGVFMDWGTGSGCLASAVLSFCPESRCVAVEREGLALMWAWKNLHKLGLLDRCRLWHSKDPWEIPVPSSSLEMIISNPPYIASEEIDSLMPEVSAYEPRPALDGGVDGLDPYRILIPYSLEKLRPGGVLALETGDDRGAREIEIMAKGLMTLESRVEDIHGIARVLVFRKPCSATM